MLVLHSWPILIKLYVETCPNITYDPVFLSITDCQEASDTDANTFSCYIVYPFIDITNADFLESPMMHLAKDNMKNMKFRGRSILPEKHLQNFQRRHHSLQGSCLQYSRCWNGCNLTGNMWFSAWEGRSNKSVLWHYRSHFESVRAPWKASATPGIRLCPLTTRLTLTPSSRSEFPWNLDSPRPMSNCHW